MSAPTGVPRRHDGPSLVSMMNLVDVASEVVVPAMRAVFKEGEVTAFGLSVTDDPEGSVALSLTARGETFEYPVIQVTFRAWVLRTGARTCARFWSTSSQRAGSAGERTGTFADAH